MTVRRSPRRRKASEDDPEEEPQQESSSTADDAPKEKKARNSTARKNRKDALRSKAMGVVVGKIDTEQSTSRKIVFGDDYEADDKKQQQQQQVEEEFKNNDDDDDDSDDEVEEVKASVAKEKVLEQMQQERKTASELQKLETKRKRKAAVEEDDEVTPMDEDFFAQLDADMEKERKEKKRASTPKGRHTAFVSTEETDDAIQAEHNIEVVVLGTSSAQEIKAVPGTQPSDAALVFSRSRMVDGLTTVKKSGVSKKKPAKVEGWKRSTKMNRHMLGRKQRKKPAAHFVIQTT